MKMNGDHIGDDDVGDDDVEEKKAEEQIPKKDTTTCESSAKNANKNFAMLVRA